LEDEKLSPEVLNKLIVTMSDFENAVKEVMPSAMREVYLESPDIPWSAIGGLEVSTRTLLGVETNCLSAAVCTPSFSCLCNR